MDTSFEWIPMDSGLKGQIMRNFTGSLIISLNNIFKWQSNARQVNLDPFTHRTPFTNIAEL